MPWYEDYIAGRKIEQTGREYVESPKRMVDLSIPQLERVTMRLLEQEGLDPDAIKRDSTEWKNAENIAKSCVTGGAGVETEQMEGGFEYKKADPAEWGRPPWEDDES